MNNRLMIGSESIESLSKYINLANQKEGYTDIRKWLILVENQSQKWNLEITI